MKYNGKLFLLRIVTWSYDFSYKGLLLLVTWNHITVCEQTIIIYNYYYY